MTSPAKPSEDSSPTASRPQPSKTRAAGSSVAIIIINDYLQTEAGGCLSLKHH